MIIPGSILDFRLQIANFGLRIYKTVEGVSRSYYLLLTAYQVDRLNGLALRPCLR
jgi:hypothetical protein